MTPNERRVLAIVLLALLALLLLRAAGLPG